MPTTNQGQLMAKQVARAHGTGGKSAHQLIDNVFVPALGNPLLSPHDAAELRWNVEHMVVTNDSAVIEPIIFPGGDIGKLAITGGINDLLTRGAEAKFASIGFILNEGLSFSDLKKVLRSMGEELRAHDIAFVCADTKVVPPSGTPGLMINTTLIGERINPSFWLPGISTGDALVVTGSLGTHGLALLQARQGLPFKTVFHSDCASLVPLLRNAFKESAPMHYLRDVTRGGLAGVLHELARQFSVSFMLNETSLPVEPAVQAGLSMLGIDALEVANEGVMLVVIAQEYAGNFVHQLRQHPLGKDAALIGYATERSQSAVNMTTAIGGRRVVPWPEALNLPRIC